MWTLRDLAGKICLGRLRDRSQRKAPIELPMRPMYFRSRPRDRISHLCRSAIQAKTAETMKILIVEDQRRVGGFVEKALIEQIT